MPRFKIVISYLKSCSMLTEYEQSYQKNRVIDKILSWFFKSVLIQMKNMERMTRRMKMKTVESLVCLIKSTENQFTTIDLQNETSVHGLVKEVDCDMNVILYNVTLTEPNGDRYYYENLFLKSRLIRYVHLSRTINIFQAMKDVVKKTFPAKIKKSSHSWKKKKTVAKQEQLKREVQNMKCKDVTKK